MPEPRRWWRVILPDRRGWLYLLASPTSYLLVLSLVLTMFGKLPIIRGYRDVDFWFSRWLLACTQDVAFFLGLAAILAFGERVRRWLVIPTTIIAVLVTAVAMINVGYMSISGEQLTWQILTLGLERFGDVSGIARATLLAHPFGLAIKLAIVIAPPVVATRLLRREAWPMGPAASVARARAAGACAVFGVTLSLVVPRPHEYALARMHDNAVLRTYWGMTTGSGTWSNNSGGFFAGYKPHDLVDSRAIEKLKTGDRPNIVVVVLESVRRDDTSLAGATGRAHTPALAALAARGVDATHARAVITQTSKSVWSMLCGRLPLLQTKLFETSSSIDVQCLPDILGAAGYRTEFFQSAMGDFEDRPRLVHALGFQSFLSSDHITGDVVGYLASDDESLAAPIESWIDEAKGAPFMATVLTSTTHHPYEFTHDRRVQLEAAHAALSTDRDRYDRGIEIADALVGEIITALDKRGLADKTIIVVVGDHGEGFGETGAKQHGSNFYEEGLHVPWVMAGPGVPHTQIDQTASLFDLTPTLLDLIGVDLTSTARAASPARSLLAPPDPDRVVPFSCYYDNACRGFVQGHTKVVFVPETGQSFAFDLERDPEEHDPRPLTDGQRKQLAIVQEIVESHRASKWLFRRDAIDTFPNWKCPAGKPCSAIRPIRK